MAKEILAQKLIVDIADGEIVRATLLYRINDAGNISGSKSVRVAVNSAEANSMIADAKDSAKLSEEIS